MSHGMQTMFPIFQLWERSRPFLCLCPRTYGGCNPERREQTGLHPVRTKGRRALLSSTFSLICQGEAGFVTYRVIPFPAFCVAGRGVDHPTRSSGPTAVRDSHVGGRTSQKALYLVRFVLIHRCVHTHSRK